MASNVVRGLAGARSEADAAALCKLRENRGDMRCESDQSSAPDLGISQRTVDNHRAAPILRRRLEVPPDPDPHSDCRRLSYSARCRIWLPGDDAEMSTFRVLFMPWQAPTLTSRNGIERRNAVEAQSPIKPTVRSQRRSRVGNHRVHLGRLGHRQQQPSWCGSECRLNLSRR